MYFLLVLLAASMPLVASAILATLASLATLALLATFTLFATLINVRAWGVQVYSEKLVADEIDDRARIARQTLPESASHPKPYVSMARIFLPDAWTALAPTNQNQRKMHSNIRGMRVSVSDSSSMLARRRLTRARAAMQVPLRPAPRGQGRAAHRRACAGAPALLNCTPGPTRL